MATAKQWEDLLFKVWLLKQRNLTDEQIKAADSIEQSIREARAKEACTCGGVGYMQHLAWCDAVV